MRAPSAASSRTTALPTPADAPVTTTTSPISGGAVRLLATEHAADLERGVAAERIGRHAVGREVGGELLGACDLRAAAVRRGEDIDPRRVRVSGPPAVRALHDRAPERDLPEGRAEHRPAQAVPEAGGRAVGD